MIKDRKSYRDFIAKERFHIKYDRLTSLQMMTSNLMPMMQAIQSMQWVVCKATQRKFILSDVNFVVQQVELSDPLRGRGGLLTPGNQSMSVLTPKVGIILSPKPGPTKYIDVNSKFVDSSNNIYALKSRRLIVAHSKATIKRIIKTTKLAAMPSPLHEVEVFSGPENKSYHYVSD